MPKIYKQLIILVIFFIGCKEVVAEDCPPKFEKINETTCIYKEPAYQRNGVYYCLTGDIVGKDCILYYYLESPENNNVKCNSGYENINGICMKYIGQAKMRSGQYYCESGTLYGISCYSTYDAAIKEGSNNGSTSGQSNEIKNPTFSNTNWDSLCTEEVGVRNAVRIAGYVVQLCKWVAPLIIIVLGMIDLFKAIVKADDKAMSGAVSSLITRIILGLVIFFIPTIVLTLIDVLGNTFNGMEKEDNQTFGACTKCLFDPFDC